MKNLTKIYPVAIKTSGLKGTLEHFFRRTYREIKAVQNISFQIQPGEVVGFLGANGAGKTTTLKSVEHSQLKCDGFDPSFPGTSDSGGLYSFSSSATIFTQN